MTMQFDIEPGHEGILPWSTGGFSRGWKRHHTGFGRDRGPQAASTRRRLFNRLMFIAFIQRRVGSSSNGDAEIWPLYGRHTSKDNSVRQELLPDRLKARLSFDGLNRRMRSTESVSTAAVFSRR